MHRRKEVLNPGWVYRGEVLDKRQHNVLTYNRTPVENIILFDVERGEGDFLSHEELIAEGLRVGLEVVPALLHNSTLNMDTFNALLQTESILGGVKVEGIVLKPMTRNLYGEDKKLLMAKFVSEEFKEKHRTEWKGIHGEEGSRTVLERLAAALTTEARWNKAIIHADEEGQLLREPKDIGQLIRSIQADTFAEEEDYIKGVLFAWAKKDLARRVIHGFPEWYKKKLIKEQLDGLSNPASVDNTNTAVSVHGE